MLFVENYLKALRNNKLVMFKKFLIPLLLLIILDASLHVIQLVEVLPSYFVYFYIYIYTIIFLVASYSLHNLLLAGDERNKKISLFSFCFLKFLLVGLFYYLILFYISEIILNSFNENRWIVFIVFLALAFIYSRLGLIIPAVALCSRISFKESWIRTSSCKVFAFMVVLVVPISLSIINTIFFSFHLNQYLDSIFQSTFIFFEISLLSVFYKDVISETH